MGAELRAGVSRFEPLLELVGLGRPTEEDVKRSVFELSQVRHVLVHRAGHADARLVERCPWLGVNVGQRLHVTKERYAKYRDAVFEYVTHILNKLTEVYGKPTGNS